MKQNLKNLHLQKNKWKGHNRNATCWAFYYVNDNKKICKIPSNYEMYYLLH